MASTSPSTPPPVPPRPHADAAIGLASPGLSVSVSDEARSELGQTLGPTACPPRDAVRLPPGQESSPHHAGHCPGFSGNTAAAGLSGAGLWWSLPNSVVARVLRRVSSRTGGFTHALVCRRWASLAPSAQTRVRFRPTGKAAPHFKGASWQATWWPADQPRLSPGELTWSLQSLPHVTSLHLPKGTLDLVTEEHLRGLLRACPRLKTLRAPDLYICLGPLRPRDPVLPFPVADVTGALRLRSAALFSACAPGLTCLDLGSRRVTGLPLFDTSLINTPAPAPPAPVGSHTGTRDGAWKQEPEGGPLAPQAGSEGPSGAVPRLWGQQLRALRARVKPPDRDESPEGALLALPGSLPHLKALSLVLSGCETLPRDSQAMVLRIGSSSLVRLRLSLRSPARLQLGLLPALRALHLTLDGQSLDFAGLSALTQLTALALHGHLSWDEDRRDLQDFAWLGSLTGVKSLDWGLRGMQLPESALQLRHLTSLSFKHQKPEDPGGTARGGWAAAPEGVPSLRSLRLESAVEDVSALAWVCSSLESLELRSVSRGGVDLAVLASLRSLTRLQVAGVPFASLPFKRLSAGLKHLAVGPAALHRGAELHQPLPWLAQRHLDGLRCLAQVQELVLSSCDETLSSLQPLSSMQSLRELSVWDCQGLKGIDASLGGLPLLQKLRLGRLDSVEELPPRLFSRPSFPSLTHVQLSLTLKAWPASLEELPRLTHLRVQLSRQEKVYQEDWRCHCYPAIRHRVELKDLRVPPSLEALELSGCDLIMGLGFMGAEDAGWDFPSPMPRLRRLTLADIETITSLPRNLGSLSGLCHLRLSSLPKLRSLPCSFTELTQLQGLVVQRCESLRSLPRGSESLPCFVADPQLLGCFEVCDVSAPE